MVSQGKDVLRRRGLYLIVQANDKGNVLRKEYAAQFLENECFSNTHAKLIADVYSKGDQDHFNMTYPLYYTKFATEPIDVSRTLGGVVLNDDRVVKSAKAWLALSKPFMGVIGVVSALMAIISSTAIGIDDSFLMLAAWHETPRHLPVVDRIRISMKHAAVSISITTLTDALAFLIGAIAPLPAL
ncbi:hypothetical protein NECAME_00724 [Necator americanus]|uniref:SSD domain-containing protein n=1 Tax=Necator americanus TaxID=51031 RepID=W2SYD5_NECAM|nr:hypothetical protein NECAME_00724 [Necator americanus]ETN73637.1 hypothetical protein NECAME_00724 [Necator americanus]